MSAETPVTDQSGRPVGMVVTPEGARIKVLGEALPPSQRGASVFVDPKGGGRPNGDFPVKHPNSGPVAKKKPPAPKTITPIDNGTLGRVYTMRLPPPGTNNQTPPPDPDERPWHERGWDEIERAGAKAFERWKKAAQTAWDALPGTADAATTAAARQSIGQGALGTLEGLGTLLGPSAEFTQAAYISGNAEAIALVEQMQQSQRAAIGAIGDSVKSAWNEAYARNGAVGASAMVLATLGMEAAGAKGLGALGKAAGTVADIVRVAKTPMEAAKKLDEAIAAAKAAGASADEIALLERARAERLAQARREAAQGKDGVVVKKRSKTHSAEKVNAEHAAKGNDPPYKPGTTVLEREAEVGERFSMVIDEKQKAMIENGEMRLGGWATSDAPQSQIIARDTLAIRPEYKADLSYVAKIEVAKPGAIIREGITGAQGSLAGGARQIELVMPPSQRGEYFRVVDITSLPEK